MYLHAGLPIFKFVIYKEYRRSTKILILAVFSNHNQNITGASINNDNNRYLLGTLKINTLHNTA